MCFMHQLGPKRDKLQKIQLLEDRLRGYHIFEAKDIGQLSHDEGVSKCPMKILLCKGLERREKGTMGRANAQLEGLEEPEREEDGRLGSVCFVHHLGQERDKFDS